METEKAKKILKEYDGPTLRIMEVCGTHTHQNFKLGIRELLPEGIKLIAGPGCPVCVTPGTYIDEALYLAEQEDTVICTFGDLLRVPGSRGSLAAARAKGAAVEIVYSPEKAVEYAGLHPDKQVIFLSVGFETTTPAVCLAVLHAEEKKLHNFSILTANKTMENVYRMLKNDIDCYLYPGHVSAITGEAPLRELMIEGISGVIAGFTAKELLTALAVTVESMKKGSPFFENCYERVVRAEGNPLARKTMEAVMEPCDSRWRGIGRIHGSGLKLRERYHEFDARAKFHISVRGEREIPGCRCGEVLKGVCRPDECVLFGEKCTPRHPIGACMVSNEGACSAYYQYSLAR